MSNGTEQDARIALLDYYGSLARHWATVLLAVAVTFYSVVQVRKAIGNDWLFSFTLTMIAAGAVYAFLRMFTLGKYCELALDTKVRPLGEGTCVSQMLHGMHHSLRTDRTLKHLDKLGDFKGFLCWTLGWACIWFFFAAAATFGFSLMGSLQEVITRLLKWPCIALVLAAAVVIFLGLVYVFTRIRPKRFQGEIRTHGG